MDIIKNIINFIKKYIKIIVNFIKNAFDKKKAFLLLGIVSLLGVIFVISSSFAAEVEVTSITFTSNDLTYDTDAGSWRVRVNASMNAKKKGEARLTYTFSSKEVIYDKAIDLVLLLDDSCKSCRESARIFYRSHFSGDLALIKFNSVGEIINDFGSSSYDFITTDNVDDSSGLSYYAALETLDKLLATGTYNADHDLKVMLITDGDPARDLGKEKNLYTQIRNNYPNLSKFYAFQYNAKGQMNETLKQISDVQYLATNVPERGSLSSLRLNSTNYDSFRLVSSINNEFFEIVSVEKNTLYGELSVTDDYFDLGFGDNNPLPTGTSFTVTATLKLKDEYKDVPGLYHILKSTGVDYRLGDVREDVYVEDTPILSNYSSVTYESNAPSGCTVSNLPSTTNVIIGEVVKISDKIPVCNGYKFNGWRFVRGSTEILGDSFVMPALDVILRAEWSKASLSKSADGTITTRGTLYGILEDEASSDGLAKEYTGQHQDDMNGTGTRKIYHYYANNTTNGTKILDKNNVVFVGICWQMIRTTDTGGVKMIYNGEVASDGTCLNQRFDESGYSSLTTIAYDNDNYTFADNYSYDKTTSSFILSGEKTVSKLNSDTVDNLIGKYSCLDGSTTNRDSCSTVYQILENYNSSMAIAGIIKSSIGKSIIGKAGYNYESEFVHDVGYMYDDKNAADYGNIVVKYERLGSLVIGCTASSILYNNGYYVFSPGDINSFGVGIHVTSPSVVSGSIKSLRYIVAATYNEYYYIDLLDGNLIENEYYVVGDAYTVNDDGTYTITTNAQLVAKGQFYINYASYAGMYFAENSSAVGATNVGENRSKKLWINTSPSDIGELSYDNYKEYFSNAVVFNYKFSEDFTYSNGSYELSGDSALITSVLDIDNYHYTCLNVDGKCDSIYYVYYSDENRLYYIELFDGKNISDTLVNLFNSNSSNSKDSIIKRIIDSWYERKLSDYTSYLDDTIFCNDRTISYLGGFDPTTGDGFSSFNSLTFSAGTDLLCVNKANSFSVGNSQAKLKYPVGLLTAAEANLVGNSILSIGIPYWLLTPYEISNTAKNLYITEDGNIVDGASVDNNYGIRPVITLKGTLRYTTGDGSMKNPYVIETK